MNSIFVIEPYWLHGTWVFDDNAVGLKAEAFVAGIELIIDECLKVAGMDIDSARDGFKLLFSHEPFPKTHVKLERLNPEHGGTWYKTNSFKSKKGEMIGWLCPALFKYFPSAPPVLYGRAEPIKEYAVKH